MNKTPIPQLPLSPALQQVEQSRAPATDEGVAAGGGGAGEETVKKKESKVEAVSVELVESYSELLVDRDSEAERGGSVKSDDDKLSTVSLNSKNKPVEAEVKQQPLEEVDAAVMQHDNEESNSLEHKHEEVKDSPEDDPPTGEKVIPEEEHHSEKELITPEVCKAEEAEDCHPSQDSKSDEIHTQATDDQKATQDCTDSSSKAADQETTDQHTEQNHSAEENQTTSVEKTEIIESSEKSTPAEELPKNNREDIVTDTTQEDTTEPTEDSKPENTLNTDQAPAEELAASSSAVSADCNPPPPPTPYKELTDTTSQTSLQSDKEHSSTKMEVDKQTGQSQTSLEKEEQIKAHAEEAPSQENIPTTVT